MCIEERQPEVGIIFTTVYGSPFSLRPWLPSWLPLFPLDPGYLPPFRFPEYYTMFRPFPGWSQQQTYHPRLRPLMKVPTFHPSHL